MKNITTVLIFLLSTLTLNAQSFAVFDIDTVSFPVMKAKFYAFDEEYNQLLNLSPDDFEIYEDGIEREVLSVSCPEPVPSPALSSVLTMDISGSMHGVMLDKAQEAARSWVIGLPLGKSECAITCFDTKNNILQDFTKDRNRLLQKIELLGAGGGTNYEAGFINPLAGGLLVARTGKYKKVLVFLTDGRPNFSPDVSAIVAEANKYNVTIFAVTLDMPCPQCLVDIAAQTGGSCFENVSTVEEAREVYMMILQASQGGGACEIEWETGYKCKSQNTELEIGISTFDLAYSTTYKHPLQYIAKLEIIPSGIYFSEKDPGVQHDTTITVTAINSDFTVTDITSSSSCFQITPSGFSLKNGESIKLQLSFIPSDSAYTFSEFDFINDICETKYYTAGGFPGKKPNVQTLKLTHPNGGEIFVVGSDTIITWEGIAPDEKVILEYSNTNGTNWLNICKTATGLSYNWNNIPGPVSDECLVRVKQIQSGFENENQSVIEWQKCLGGTNFDQAYSIQQTSDGGYIIAGNSSSNDGDVVGNNGNSDIWVVKINGLGDKEWQKCLGGQDNETVASIKQTLDGGYILAGYTGSNNMDVSGNNGRLDIWIVKLNISGEIEWQKCLGGSDFEIVSGQAIFPTIDYGFIVVAKSLSDDDDVTINHGSWDIWIIKINATGEIEWQKCIGGSHDDFAYSIYPTDDNGFIIAGNTYSGDGDVTLNHGSLDMWIVKINSIGDIEWQKSYGGSAHDEAGAVLPTLDGGYIFSGKTYSKDRDVSGNHGVSDIWIVKIDSIGEIEWQKCYGGSNKEEAYTLQATKDGGYIVGGSTESSDGDVTVNYGLYDIWIIKINSDGELEWQKSLGGSKNDFAFDIIQTFDLGYIVTGGTNSNDGHVVGHKYGDYDCWVVKLSSDREILQEDVSDSVFAIVEPEISGIDIDMGTVLVGQTKDSVITEFITNIGTWDCRIDSIYIQGTDASAFSLVSGIPQYTVAKGASHFAEFGFRPSKAGLHEAEIVIVSQADTLFQNICGVGIEPMLAVICDIIDFGEVQLTEHKDTVKAIIENAGTASIEITKTEITGPDIDQFEIIDGGGSFILNPGDERELTLRFEPEYLGKTSTNLNFYHKEAGAPALTQLYGEGIKQEADCDSSGFEYPDFTGVDDIILAGNTGKVDDYIRLTYAKQSVIGGIWHEKPVLVGNGFITEFSFSMSSGNNVNTDDGSLPGADGLAFVIQNNENIDMGLYGGGIGYHGIEKAIAVEFDLFMNNSKQIIDFKDPNGNHAAIQKKYGDKLSALHNSNNTIEINEDIPELKTDGTIYYVKIEYNIEPNVMSVYLDDTGVLDDPVIVAGGIELTDIVSLKEDLKAFVGITSATGNAYQIHDLLDWYFCPFPVDITAVESKKTQDEITFNIYPNPASESTAIEINNPEYQFISLSITDIFGSEVKSLFSGYKTKGNITFKWNTGEIPDGVYFCRLNLGDENMVRAIVVNK